MTKSHPELGESLPLPAPNPDMLSFLQRRRSNLAKDMTGPGPSDTDISHMLQIAARVPDHRKLAPWRFILFSGEARREMGAHIRKAFEHSNPDAPEERAEFEAQRFLRAPLVIAVVSAPRDCPRGTPEWEQVLSAGAVCYNLLLAAQGLGYAAQWLTEWYSYEASVCAAMGLQGREKVAGLIYIGRTKTPPSERARPNIAEKIQYWP